MSGVHPGAESEGRFDTVDPKLTVFALANGMDLAKGDGYRRLEWFTEGLERGILVQPDEGGAFKLTVMSWKTGNPEDRTESDLGAGISPDDLSGHLTAAIDAANGL